MEDSYHLIGIGGIGMSSLAHILLQKSCHVSGSDSLATPLTEELEKEGAHIYRGHRSNHVMAGQTVVYSTAIQSDNIELGEAKVRGCRLIHRSELLAELTCEQQAILVAGTHGKTTVTALLAHILIHAGLDPSYVIGGTVACLPAHGRLGRGEYFVAEADESDGSFLKGKAHGAIVTNIEPDHLDYWKSWDKLKEGFTQFIAPFDRGGPFVWCYDDPTVRTLASSGKSYGFEEGADLQVIDAQGKGELVIQIDGYRIEHFQFDLRGKYNALNGAAAVAMALELNVPLPAISEALATFKGVARRLEQVGSKGGIDYYDDYAHHPTAIRATYEAMKEIAGDRRVIVVFQPHRPSRVHDLIEGFQEALSEISPLVLVPTYLAGEEEMAGLDEDLALGITSREHYTVDRGDVSSFLDGYASAGDIVLTMGAGDITQVGRRG